MKLLFVLLLSAFAVNAAPLTPTYTISITTRNGGSVTLEPNLTRFPEGTEVKLTASPYFGWKFRGWLGDAQGTNLTQTLTVTRNMKVETIFTTTFFDDIEAGRGTKVFYPAAEEYPAQSRVWITAIPDAGYYFDSWAGTGFSMENENPRYHYFGGATPLITVLFKKLPSNHVAVTVLKEGLGSVKNETKEKYHPAGSTVTLRAIPTSSKDTFLHWSGDIASTENPLILTPTNSMVITAHFTRSPYLSITNETGNRISLFTSAGQYGDVYRLESSTNLVDWVPIQKRTNFFDTMELYPPTSTGSQIYRVVVE